MVKMVKLVSHRAGAISSRVRDREHALKFLRGQMDNIYTTDYSPPTKNLQKILIVDVEIYNYSTNEFRK